MGIIHGILSIPHNNIMDLNNVMLATPYDIKRPAHVVVHSTKMIGCSDLNLAPEARESSPQEVSSPPKPPKIANHHTK